MNGLIKPAVNISGPERWPRKLILAVVDQGLFSVSNFLFSIMLARWLLPETYGVFSIVFSLFLLISGWYNVLILEPMSIYGASRFRDCLISYFRTLLKLHNLWYLGFALIL